MRTALIFTLLLRVLSQAQAADAFLEPDDGYFSSLDFEHKYYAQVRDLLLKGATDRPLARMVVLESFTAEVAISLEEQDGKYVVVRRSASVPIWKNKEPDKIKIAVRKVELDKETALLIHEVLFLATSQTRYPGPAEGRAGFDGTTYYFSAGRRAGQTWSPDEKSPMGALVACGSRLNEYLLAKPEQREAIKLRLQTDGRMLLKRLSKTPDCHLTKPD